MQNASDIPEEERAAATHKMLKYALSRDTIALNRNAVRELVNKGKKLGIRPAVMVAITEAIIRELVDEMFADSEVE